MIRSSPENGFSNTVLGRWIIPSTRCSIRSRKRNNGSARSLIERSPRMTVSQCGKQLRLCDAANRSAEMFGKVGRLAFYLEPDAYRRQRRAAEITKRAGLDPALIQPHAHLRHQRHEQILLQGHLHSKHPKTLRQAMLRHI